MDLFFKGLKWKDLTIEQMCEVDEYFTSLEEVGYDVPTSLRGRIAWFEAGSKDEWNL